MATDSADRSTAQVLPGAVALVLLVGAAVLGLLPTGLPEPVDASAPPHTFSSERALEHVRVLARAPHPMGSQENASVRAYLIEELNGLGLQPEVQAATTARSGITGLVAGRPHNVLARVEGTSGDKRAFLLMAHYDSVATGPGASDDAAGVGAMLETARAITTGPQLRNDVILLFTDGEERGLLGAQAFVEGHRWADDVEVVLNLEARGNTGAARVFETGEQNGWLIRELGRAVPHPVANSGTTAGYRLSGSDTDLTVLLDAGRTGLNVGYLEGLTHYHTRLDTIEQLDQRSLQHLGSYALGLTRQLGDADLSRPKASDEIYFTVLGFLFHYPVGWVIPVMAFTVLLFAGALALGFRRRQVTIGGILVGSLGLLAGMTGAGLSVFLLWWLVRLRYPGDDVWVLQYRAPLYWVGLASVTVAVFAALYAALSNRVRTMDLALGAMLWWLIATVLTSWLFPAASFGFAWPLIVSLGGLGALLALGDRVANPWGTAAVLTLTAVPVLLIYASAIEGVTLVAGLLVAPIVPVFAVVIAVLLGLLIPHLNLIPPARRGIVSGVAAISGLGLVLIGAAAADFDARHPKPNSIVYALNKDTDNAVWASYDAAPDDWTAHFLGSNPDHGPVPDHVPNAPQPLLHSGAPVVDLPAPAVRLLDSTTGDGVRTLRVRVIAPPDAVVATVTTNVAISRATIDGRPVPELPDPEPGRPAWTVSHWSPSPQGFQLTLQVMGGEPLVLKATAGTPGLPRVADRSYPDRPAHTMPITEDMTLVTSSHVW